MFEPTPDFSTPPLSAKVGTRPWRRNGYCLKGEEHASDNRKYIIHNYGHGGAGVTLSWGCASIVSDIVRVRAGITRDQSVAVIGAGVMGLTSATMIKELGYNVTIYAKDNWRDTTSSVAAAQWAPSAVLYADETEFADVLKIAYRRFYRETKNGFGVTELPNYTPQRNPALDLVERLVPDMIPKPVPMQLPFEHMRRSGFKYETLLVETPIFLKRLETDLVNNNVQINARTFSSQAEVLQLSENIIVNCTGMGAKALWDDCNLVPIKGELALLKAQSNLQYMFSRDGYLFPRGDTVIVGGTYKFNDDTTNEDPAVTKQLVDHMKGVFGVAPKVSTPRNLIDHKEIRPLAEAQEVVTS